MRIRQLAQKARFANRRGGLISAFHGYEDVLNLRVELHCLHSEVASKAATFEAAERRLHVYAALRVDAQYTGSRPTNEVKQHRAVLGLGWDTA